MASFLFRSLFFTLALATVASAASISDRVRKHLRDRVAVGESPGIIIGVADRQGQIFASAGAPRLDAQGRPLDEKTVFEIGSITKTFTALLLQMAVDGGMVRMNEQVKKQLSPGLDLGAHVGGISLLQLATHRSGLPRMPDNFRPANPKNPYADYSQDQFFDWLRKVNLGEPHFSYSNAGMGLLGQLLEIRSGSKFESLMRTWIAVPLGLNDTVVSLSAEQRRRSATPYSEGTALPMWDIPTLAGAGALRSTASDVLRWSSLHAGIIDSPLRSAMEEVQSSQGKSGPGTGKVAIGWLIRPSSQGNLVWHSGGTGGTRAWTGFNRRAGRSVVVLANSSVIVDDIGFHLLDPDLPMRTPRKVAPASASLLRRCEGIFQIGKSQMTIKPDGSRLSVQITGQTLNPAYWEGNLSFFFRAVDAQLSFEEGADGKMKAVVLHQNGKNQRGERLTLKPR
jgi:CubicO group peptidase (beta-lactamase class C family)